MVALCARAEARLTSNTKVLVLGVVIRLQSRSFLGAPPVGRRWLRVTCASKLSKAYSQGHKILHRDP